LSIKPQKTQPKSSYFLYVGRQDVYKNLHRLIHAFAALPGKENYQLYLVGAKDPRFSPHLSELARTLGVAEQIKFLDYVSYAELPILYSQAMALVFPSLWEGFGIPALEAMACGTPVITSNISALPEVVGEAGLLIDPYNTEAITEALAKVAQDSQLRSKMSESSLQRASEFSWLRTGEQTKNVLARYV
jgi:glycosyltransferase involved in cell wall biosynthesis